MAKSPTPRRRKTTSPKTIAKSVKTRAKAASAKPATKLDQIVAALRAPKGASIKRLVDITGWQVHSVRGALAGSLKKKRGLTITSTKIKEERVYRIEGGK